MLNERKRVRTRARPTDKRFDPTRNSFFWTAKRKKQKKFDTDMLENAGQRIQGGSFEALAGNNGRYSAA